MAATREELIQGAQSEALKIEETKAATEQETSILNALDWFKSKDNGSYATYDDAVKLIESNKDPEVWFNIKAELKTRAQNDTDSKYATGIDKDLGVNTFYELRKNIAKDNVDLAKELNRDNIYDNYKNIEKYLDTDNLFKIEGIDPSEGAPTSARVSMSYASMGGDQEKNIKNALIYSLPEQYQDLYQSLNYKGPDIHVQFKNFADGKKRAIFKIPEELGGDNKYRLFNEPGEWKKDVAGFTGDIPTYIADMVVGYYSAGGGPNAVAINTAVTNAVGEYIKLKIGQDFFNQNQDLNDMSLMKEAATIGGITGVTTKAMFPIMNVAKRMYLNVVPKIGLGKFKLGTKLDKEGALARQIVKDFVRSYKMGAGKNTNDDLIRKELIDQFMKPKDEGGLGYTLEQAQNMVKPSLASTNPSTIVGATAKEVSKTPAGTPTFFGSKVKQEAYDEAKNITQEQLNIQKKIISEITGIDVTKLSELNMAGDAFQTIQKIANEKYRSNLIKQTDFSNKFIDEWKVYKKKYISDIKPTEQNFNEVFTDIIGKIDTNNFAIANNLSSEMDNVLGKLTVTFPKTNLKKGVVSPSKLMNDAINELKNFKKFAKKNNLTDSDIEQINNNINVLSSLRSEFNTTSKMSALEVENALDNLEMLKTYYPNVSNKITALQSSLRSARNKSYATLDDAGKNLLNKRYQFIEKNRMTKDGVIGEIIKKVGGTKGQYVAFKNKVIDDQFDTLFGNKQSQIQALKYIKSGLDGGLSKNKADQLKTMMHNKFIAFIENGGTVNEFNKKYGKAYSQIFNPDEMKSFTSVMKSRGALEKIISNQLYSSQVAKNIFPVLRNVDISNMNYKTISEAVFSPDVTPKQINTFFNQVSKQEGGEEAVKSIKSFYLKNVLDAHKITDPVLGRNTLDGNKLFTWFNDVKNEQVFTNMFGRDAAKNMKTIAAQLNLMQNFPSYVSKDLSESAAKKMRETATRMVYGPLSHENVLIKGAIFFLNSFDQRLGKELFDYDFFIEKFKNSYMAKYAPALNDKKFMYFYNTYDAGTAQKAYTALNTSLGLGVGEEFKGQSLSDTGLPSFDFIDTLAMAEGTLVEPSVKSLNSAIDTIIKNVETSDKTKEKEKTLKKIRELKE